jgi:hypothetical protein
MSILRAPSLRSEIAARVWEAKQCGCEREAKTLTSYLEEQKERKNKLLDTRMDGELSRRI